MMGAAEQPRLEYCSNGVEFLWRVAYIEGCLVSYIHEYVGDLLRPSCRE